MNKTKEEINTLEDIWKSLGLFFAGTAFGIFFFAITIIQLPSMIREPVSISFFDIGGLIFSFLILTVICIYMKVSVRDKE